MASIRFFARSIIAFSSAALLLAWTAPRELRPYVNTGGRVQAASGPLAPRHASSMFPGLAAELSATSKAAISRSLDSFPLSFVENRGQIDQRVRFYVEGTGTRLYFTSSGVTFTIPNAAGSTAGGPVFAGASTGTRAGSRSYGRWTVKLNFIGAADVRPSGLDPAATVVSYFKGSKDQWKTGLRTYSRILYPNLWPGIDLVFTGASNKVKYEFRVRPGADPARIKFTYEGASVGLDPSGDLNINTPAGVLGDERPYSYQDERASRNQIGSQYRIDPGGAIGFTLGAYDRSRELLIDPAVIAYAGYIGGNLVDTAFGIAVDSQGAAYVAGYTESTPSDGFPVTVGPGTGYNNNKHFLFWTAFVAKVKPDGSALEYCGYIDGAGHQLASAIAVDSTGAAYVTGFTTSAQDSFPVTVGPSLIFNGGTEFMGDAFVAKVKPDGTFLDYCGYIGGSGEDAGYGIAVDSAGNAYVTGETNSLGPGQAVSPGGASVTPFPAVGGPFLANAGGPDAFVAKVKADGSGLAYAGFLGGSGLDEGLGVAVDASGAAYITGVTASPAHGFQGLSVGPQLTPGGEMDAFVAKVKPNGSGVDYCGYIGGSSSDEGLGIAVDGSGNAYVAGETNSDQTTFPVKVGPKLTYSGSDGNFGDAFIAKVSGDGSSLVYCGYIGGSGGDAAYRVAVDSEGSAYLTGSTNSSATTFPVTAATGAAATYSGGTVFGDAFIAKVDPSGASLLYAGYLGGSEDDAGIGIAVDSSGAVYIGGATMSAAPSFPATVGPSLTYNPGFFGEADAFVAKMTGLPGPSSDFSLSFSSPTITVSRGSKTPVTLDINRTGTFTGAVSLTPPANLPRGVVPILDTTPTTAPSATFRLKVKGKAVPGTDELVFTGTDSSGKLVHTATLTLNVQ